MNSIFLRVSFLILISVWVVRAQQTFSIISFEGKARVQQGDKQVWTNATIGSTLKDNDIIETYFQTKVVLRSSGGNIVIFGSNSKGLINVGQKTGPDGPLEEISITLFAGGVFSKVVSRCHISIYTSNAVAETYNGSLSSITDAKSGETGFQVLGGSINARNIAQKDGKTISVGQTTIVLPGKEPTAPLYMTYRHVAVLKHFFGDEYIANELAAAGIKPTDDRPTQARMGLTQGFGGGSGKPVDDDMYKQLFSLDRIYGRILEDQSKERQWFVPVIEPRFLTANSFDVGLEAGMRIAGIGAFAGFGLLPAYHAKAFDAALRINLAADATGAIGMYGLTTLAGWLSFIDHITVVNTAPFPLRISVEKIKHLTMGSGLVVRDFKSSSPYELLDPPGLRASVQVLFLDAQLFLNDLSNPSIGGFHIDASPSTYHFGAGYYFDADQLKNGIPEEPFALVPLKLVVPVPDADSAKLAQQIYEVNFGVDIMNVEELRVSFSTDWAQNVAAGNGSNFAIQFPIMNVDVAGIKTGGGFTYESGNFLWGNFHSFYSSNRCRIIKANIRTNPDTLIAQSVALSPDRRATGIMAFFDCNPTPVTGLEIFYKQDIANHSPLLDSTIDPLVVNWGVRLSATQKAIPFLRHASLSLSQVHTGLFPGGSGLFSSWGFSTTGSMISVPIRPLFDLCVVGDLDLSFVDVNFNNKLDPNDMVFTISIGLHKGFL